jgi:ABC-2 type transport system permease protein
MFARIRQMIIKEFIQVFRDSAARFSLIVPPIMQILIFGYAANFEVHHVNTAVLDFDHSQESRELIARLGASDYFDVDATLTNHHQLARAIDRGDVALALQILPGFAENLRRQKSPEVQVILDGTNSNTALIALGYVSQIGQRYANDYQLDYLNRVMPTLAAQIPAVELEPRPWFNPDLNSKWFFVPATIGTLTLTLVVMMTAFAIVREREIGTLEQLMVTPISAYEFIAGKTIPYLLIALGQLGLMAVAGVWWFQIPLRGNLGLLLLASVLFIVSILAVGLFISTISATQQQAMVASFFFVMPSITLSGFSFPISSMPPWLQWLTFLDPLRYYLVVLRGTFLKGVGFATLWPQIAATGACAVVLLVFSARRFQKTLD